MRVGNMKRRFGNGIFFLLLIWGLFFTTACQQTLKVDALKTWEIVLDTTSTIPSEQFAVREFQRLFNRLTGYHLPVVQQPTQGKGHIFIGPSKALQQYDSLFAQQPFGEEDLAIKITKQSIAILGGRPRGTLYGVYEFLERYLGVRFLTADFTYFPAQAHKRKLPIEQFIYHPPFNFRWPYYGQVRKNHLFAARLRVNTTPVEDSLGGKSAQQLINHSFRKQIPVQKYGKTHPEYFALINGKRVLDMWGGGPEPCVSNPQVMDIVTRAVLQEIEEHPEYSNYSVSQNDNNAYCQCDSCSAINQREESPMGAQLRFVNEIARRVAEVYPQKKIGTLSYWYTRKPPKHLKPAKNVQIQFADIEACRVHPIDDPNCPKNRSVLRDLLGWLQKTDQLYMWTYMTDFRYYDLPFPNFNTIGHNIRFYAEHGVKGVFAQAHGNSTVGDLSDLRVYVTARCLWNPQRDLWQEVKEFCRLYYGKAAPAILEYVNFIQKNIEQKGKHPTCFASPQQLGLDQAVALKLLKIFENALALAESETIKQRVEKASISAWRTLIEAGATFKVENNRLKRMYPEPYANAIDRYIELAEKYGLERSDESTPFHEYKKILIEQYKNGLPIALLENDYWRLLIDKANNGRVIEMTYKPRNLNLLLAYEANMRYGVLEEWFGEKTDVKTFTGPLRVTFQKGTVTLERQLKNGTLYQQQISFDPQKPEIIRFKTVLRHVNPKPSRYQLIVHPEFNVHSTSKDWQEVTAYVWANGHWQPYNRQMWQNHGPDTEWLVKGVAGGKHAFYNHEKQFGLIETYNPAQVEKLRTWWVPEQKQLNLEIQSKAVQLKAGDSWTFEYQIRFWPKFE